jgi:hypothetical protein
MKCRSRVNLLSWIVVTRTQIGKMPGTQNERRRHARFILGLPVGLRIGRRKTPLIVELLDVSESGARFQTMGDEVRVADRATFGFVSPEAPRCHAEGRVLRVDRAGQFVVAFDDANDDFVGFIRLLAAES